MYQSRGDPREGYFSLGRIGAGVSGGRAIMDRTGRAASSECAKWEGKGEARLEALWELWLSFRQLTTPAIPVIPMKLPVRM